ncbi:MAG: dihydroneopterin triphosphate diphosphatase [Burkholderiaceae bacterium]
MPMKIPVSVLVVIHTRNGQVLLLERADHPGFWQSVTGSKDTEDEALSVTCKREVLEETGIDQPVEAFCDWQQTNQYEILAHWRKRYAPGVTHNTEHLFSLQLPEPVAVCLAPKEHVNYQWLPWRDAADRCFSWTNLKAIRALPERGLVSAEPHA